MPHRLTLPAGHSHPTTQHTHASTMDTMLKIITEHPFIAGWLAFVAIVYLFALSDYIYYRCDIKRKAIQFYEAITEEE